MAVLNMTTKTNYRGRLAPTPTGYLHLGHARTFSVAQARAREAGGALVLRNDDLDRERVRPEFTQGLMEDLRWLGLNWDEGPFNQSERIALYRGAFERLKDQGAVYPCACSRRDVLRALQAPHPEEEEPVYPGTCRAKRLEDLPPGTKVSWRFRVPDGEVIGFEDGNFGPQRYRAGMDFGDFVVWRHDHLPSYQLACAVDDADLRITEVVRGADLLGSTARQLLIYRALQRPAPEFYHCPLLTDEHGARLAKRNDALSLRSLRALGRTPGEIRSFAAGSAPLLAPRIGDLHAQGWLDL